MSSRLHDPTTSSAGEPAAVGPSVSASTKVTEPASENAEAPSLAPSTTFLSRRTRAKEDASMNGHSTNPDGSTKVGNPHQHNKTQLHRRPHPQPSRASGPSLSSSSARHSASSPATPAATQVPTRWRYYRCSVFLFASFTLCVLAALLAHHSATNYRMQDESLAELRRLQRGLRIDDASADDVEWFARPANITIMSYNLRGANLDPVVNTWHSHRRQVLASSLLKYRPSIVGTQEGIEYQLRDLMSLLPSSWRLFGNKRTSNNPEDEHVALIYNSDEVEIVKGGDFWLSPTPDVPGSSAWGSAFPRMATWAKFRQLSTGHQFYVVNTHMDHVSEQARVEGARVLVETIDKLRKKNRAVILTGDFNAAPGQGSYETLRKAGFNDAWSTSHKKGTILHQARSTFHHYFGTKLETWYCNIALYLAFRYHGGRFPHFGRYHIDWILYKNGDESEESQHHTKKAAISVELDAEKEVARDKIPPETLVEPLCAMICTDAENLQYPSDHYPVLSVFELKRSKQGSTSTVGGEHNVATDTEEGDHVSAEPKEVADLIIHDAGKEHVQQRAD